MSREFSKFMSRVYLVRQPKAVSVHDFEHLVSMFNTKCFYAACSPLLSSAAFVAPREDLDIYVKRSRDKALDYYDPVKERMLVDICLHGMLEEYRIFLENIFVSSFSKIIEAARLTNGTVHILNDQVPQDRPITTPHQGRSPSFGPLRREKDPGCHPFVI